MTELAVLEVPGKLDGVHLIDADVDADGCVACLVERDGRILVLRDGTEVAGIPETAMPFLHTIRWLPNDALLLHPIANVTDAPTQSCAIVAGEDFQPVPFGAPDNLAAGGGFVFASYSERALIFTRIGSHEGDVVTVFDVRGGARCSACPTCCLMSEAAPIPMRSRAGAPPRGASSCSSARTHLTCVA